MILKGTIFEGRKEGAHYIKIYEEEIKKLNLEPFFGTLNIHADPRARKEFLETVKPTKIGGFSKEGKKYGSLLCFPAQDMQGEPLLIVVPEITHHDNDVLEIVSTKNLRKEYNLSMGDQFTIKY